MRRAAKVAPGVGAHSVLAAETSWSGMVATEAPDGWPQSCSLGQGWDYDAAARPSGRAAVGNAPFMEGKPWIMPGVGERAGRVTGA